MQDNTDDKFGIVEQLAMRILLAEEDCWWCKGRDVQHSQTLALKTEATTFEFGTHVDAFEQK
jgi:hypothetical protein